MFRTALLAATLIAIQASAEEKPLRVYFVGNSVTDTINYRGLAELAKSRGHQQVWGRHMIPGAPLQWIWQHPKDGFQEQPFGHYPTALANFQRDVLSLQPFDRHLEGKDGDLTMAKNFIDLALPKSPDLQVYVYARWPRTQVGGKPFAWVTGVSASAPTPAAGKVTLFSGYDDWGTTWLRGYTGGWDGTNETKDYFERLTLELRKAYPKLKIHMVPVGHVMYELDRRMKASEVLGFKTIWEVYKDGIHLNNVGSYVVGCTYFATLYKKNPMGLPGEPYKVSDRKLAEIIQETVWRVVRTNELAGVATSKSPGTKTSFKGWELYIWQQDGDTYYSLMPGTNRLKTDEEISKAAVKGLDAIKPKLEEVKAGEMVFIHGKRMAAPPPPEQAKLVREYCRKLGLAQ
jgi:hypothetical protein